MSYQTHFDSPVWRVTFFDVLTQDDILEALRDLIAAETDSKIVPPRITDMTRVTEIKARFQNMRTSAGNRRRAKFPNSFKSAIIATGVNQLGYARMFQTLNDNPQIEIKVFPDETSALTWINEQKAD